MSDEKEKRRGCHQKNDYYWGIWRLIMLSKRRGFLSLLALSVAHSLSAIFLPAPSLSRPK
jgi:hypothetical protein